MSVQALWKEALGSGAALGWEHSPLRGRELKAKVVSVWGREIVAWEEYFIWGDSETSLSVINEVNICLMCRASSSTPQLGEINIFL